MSYARNVVTVVCNEAGYTKLRVSRIQEDGRVVAKRGLILPPGASEQDVGFYTKILTIFPISLVPEGGAYQTLLPEEVGENP